ncbi:MAG: tetratricopeptide repeat protein [Verrucomicrobiaceae bacterium]|nr:tetratricopeptide repeat protein [Verrucomicrobiaceae bacterium]
MKALLLVLLCLGVFFPLPAQDAADAPPAAAVTEKDEAAERLAKRIRLADELEAQGDYGGAAQILGELADADPDNVALLERVVGLLMRGEQFQKAIPRLRKLLELKDGTAADHGALARMMIELGETEAAIDFLQDAAKRFPESAEFPFLLTFPLAQLERWNEAIAEFEKAIPLAENMPGKLDAGFYFRFGAAQERTGNFTEAEKLFHKTLDLLEENDPAVENRDFKATVLNYLAYMWIERGEKLDESGPMAEEAARLSPGSGAIADTVGWYHFQKGNYPRALVSLKKAENLIEEPDPVIFDHIGQTLAKLNEKEFAAGYFRKALELDPENKALQKRLAELEE